MWKNTGGDIFPWEGLEGRKWKESDGDGKGWRKVKKGCK